MYFAGLDIGSTMTKAVVTDEEENILGYVLGPTGPEHRRLANEVMAQTLDQVGLRLEDISYIVSTGYGRVNVPFSDAQVTEITCHARGVSRFFPKARTVIDIGGQDSKGIRVEGGKVVDFVMNDKCAAGTGRFLEIVAEILGVQVSELADLALTAKKAIKISNICTAFAAQEVMAFLAEGTPAADIAAGLHQSLAIRIYNMFRRIGTAEEVIVTGGVAKNRALVKEIEDRLGVKSFTLPEPLISGAVGAALIGKEKVRKAAEAGKTLPRKERRLEEARLFD